MTAAEREGTELDDLRRRLYRADATQEDLEHYLDERAAIAGPEAPEAPPAVPRPSRRLLLPVAIGAVLLLCVGATGVLLHHAPIAPHAAASPSPTTVRIDADSGRLLPVDPGQVNGPAVSTLTIDGDPTIVQRFDGVGRMSVRVRLPGAVFGVERAVVALYSARPSNLSWRAIRTIDGAGSSTSVDQVAAGSLLSRPDSADPDFFTYAGAPPTRVAVDAPPGLHWSLVVAVADGRH